MLTFLGLAFMIGMSHALEADHVAAVSAIAAKQTRLSSIIRIGAVWGLGHTLTLAAFGGVVLVFGLAINEHLAGWLELFVGLMLVGLGSHILYRLIRDRIHFHMHHHAGESAHFHAHSHAEQTAHDHTHKAFPFRSLLVGMMHGMAGSAALLILTASSAPSPGQGLAYVALFGLGSILGMACLSAIIAVPLAWSARFLTWGNWGLQGSIGLATLTLGLNTIYVAQATL